MVKEKPILSDNIYAIDTETRGLQATRNAFILGVIMNNKGESKTFTKPEELWNYIKEIGVKNAKSKRPTYIYAHNMEYDYNAIAEHSDPNLEYLGYYGIKAILNTTPKEEWKKYSTKRKITPAGIYFIDSASLMRGELKEVGNKIGIKKLEMPKELTNNKRKFTEEDYWNIEKYCKRDTLIVLKLIEKVRTELNNADIKVKKLTTISRIGLRYLINYIREQDYKYELLEDRLQHKRESIKKSKRKHKEKYKIQEKYNENLNLIRPKVETLREKVQSKEIHLRKLKEHPRRNKEKIKNIETSLKRDKEDLEQYEKIHPHKSYRGARVQAFKLGFFNNCYQYDARSLYPYSATQLDEEIPKLNTEQLINDPLNTYPLQYIINKIGLSRCLIETPETNIGIVPVRLSEKDTEGVYYPKKRTYIIGTWTNLELREFLKEGVKIHAIDKSLIYEPLGKNPFKEIMQKLFRLRGKDDFNKTFFKSCGNFLIGKAGQREKGYQYRNFRIQETNPEKLKKKGWEFMYVVNAGIHKYRKQNAKTPSEDYNPFLPSLINAKARIIMNRILKKIIENEGDIVLYIDNDGFITTKDIRHYLKIGKKLGEFKIEQQNKSFEVIVEKTYKIGEEYKIAGIRKADITDKAWKDKTIKSKRMITTKTAKKQKEIGTFQEEIISLKQIQETRQKREEEREKKEWLMDSEEKQRLDYPILKKITEINKERRKQGIKPIFQI